MNCIAVKPFREEDRTVLTKVCEQDGHRVIAPSFVVEKEKQLIGYLGIVPSVLVWLDSARTLPRDSLVVLSVFENIIRTTGGAIVCVPCTRMSPLFPFMSKVEYVDCGESVLFLKNLNT